MRASAQELAPFGITVNAVSPPLTATGPVLAYLDTLRELGMPDDQLQTMSASMSDPADVAPIAVFLATPEGRTFSGQVFTMTRTDVTALTAPTPGLPAAAPPFGWTIDALARAAPGLVG